MYVLWSTPDYQCTYCFYGTWRLIDPASVECSLLILYYFVCRSG
uniref:Uncharacterized protein n=1 Tax=Anguilla anguilla TaxID=7936 RepID=A0A0E9WNA1_ANGAN